MIVEIFNKKGKKLTFFGSRHSADPKQIRAIRKSIVETKPEIILVESGYDRATYPTKKEAIQQGQECGYVAYLAKKRGIKIQSNDPSDKFIDEKVSLKYGKDITFLYSMLRIIIHTRKKINFDYYFKNSAGYYQYELQWKNFNCTYNNFKRIFIKEIKEEFDLNKNYFDYFDPTLDYNILNGVTRDINDIRKSYMLKLLKKLLKKYNNIFLIKGQSHLLFEKENIKKIFDKII